MLIHWAKIKCHTNTEALLEASRDGGLEVNTEKTKYIFATFLFSLSSSHLLSRNLKIKICEIIILTVFCMDEKLGLSR